MKKKTLVIVIAILVLLGCIGITLLLVSLSGSIDFSSLHGAVPVLRGMC